MLCVNNIRVCSRFAPKTGYLLCNYALPEMKGEGDLKWSFLSDDLFIRVSWK